MHRLQRFAFHPEPDDGGPWRVSRAVIGAMVNATDQSDEEFARQCYRYLLARERGEDFDVPWLDTPRLLPQPMTSPDQLDVTRRAIPDLRPGEVVVHLPGLL